MSKTAKEIRDIMRNMAGTKTELFSGVVASVDESTATMEVWPDPEDKEFLLPVMLRATDDEVNGVIIVPEANSEVVYCSIDGGNEFTLVSASKVAKVIAKDVVIIVNDGKNGGVPIAAKIDHNLEVLETYAKAIKSAIDKALTTIDGVAGSTGAQVFKLAMATATVNFQNMENPQVKH